MTKGDPIPLMIAVPRHPCLRRTSRQASSKLIIVVVLVVLVIIVLIVVLIVVTVRIERHTAAQRWRKKTDNKTLATATTVKWWRCATAIKNILDDGWRRVVAAKSSHRWYCCQPSAIDRPPLQLNLAVVVDAHCCFALPSLHPPKAIIHHQHLQKIIVVVKRRQGCVPRCHRST